MLEIRRRLKNLSFGYPVQFIFQNYLADLIVENPEFATAATIARCIEEYRAD